MRGFVLMRFSIAQLSNQDWYARRGYAVFKTVKKMWKEIDVKGKEWWFSAVFMRKNI